MKPTIPSLRAFLAVISLGCLPAIPAMAQSATEPPVPVRTVPPEIPQDFARAGGSGLVTVNFLVDEQGAVQDARVEKTTSPDLDASALKAVKKWKFKPAKKDGAPVAIRVTIPIKFEVQ